VIKIILVKLFLFPVKRKMATNLISSSREAWNPVFIFREKHFNNSVLSPWNVKWKIFSSWIVKLLNTVLYSTVQYSLYSTVQYIAVQYSTVQYSTVQYSTVQYSTVQYSTVQYIEVQYINLCSYILDWRGTRKESKDYQI
jgi:hypothetical protein